MQSGKFITFGVWLMILFNLLLSFGAVWSLQRMNPEIQRIYERNVVSLDACEKMLLVLAEPAVDMKVFSEALQIAAGNITENGEQETVIRISTLADKTACHNKIALPSGVGISFFGFRLSSSTLVFGVIHKFKLIHIKRLSCVKFTQRSNFHTHIAISFALVMRADHHPAAVADGQRHKLKKFSAITTPVGRKFCRNHPRAATLMLCRKQ